VTFFVLAAFVAVESARALTGNHAPDVSMVGIVLTSLSIVVLGGLLLNAAFGWWWADPLAALGVVMFLIREGRHALTAEHADDCC
jgi:divalent metal cation (Fe/Co/Zn/Cd) transporter